MINWLMLFKEIINVDIENQTKSINKTYRLPESMWYI
jgi:hypothetical protein